MMWMDVFFLPGRLDVVVGRPWPCVPIAAKQEWRGRPGMGGGPCLRRATIVHQWCRPSWI